MRYSFIQQQQTEYPVRVLCRVLKVSASGYYRWCKQPQSARSQANQYLLQQVQQIHEQSQKRYGSPKIQQVLSQQGVKCGRNRIMRLMRQGGLASKRQRCFKRTTRANPKHCYAPNLLQQQFVASRPNQIWLSDLTYIATAEGWLYLAAVLDLYSRRIIGWAMGDNMTDSLTTRALQMALRQRKPHEDTLLHHSDRGSNYTSGDYQTLLARYHIQVSMSGTGNCYDNAPMESFFAQLKLEEVFHHKYLTRQAAKNSIFAYIEGFYNNYRLHSSLNYRSPIQFEADFSQSTFPFQPVL